MKIILPLNFQINFQGKMNVNDSILSFKLALVTEDFQGL